MAADVSSTSGAGAGGRPLAGHRVAVVGTGRMGAAMAGRLAAAGARLTLWNRTAARAQVVATGLGAAVAPSPRAATERAEVVLVSLADDDAVAAAYAGEDGLVAGLRDDVVVLEASTVSPGTVRRLAPAVAERGGTLLDAPVSGSVSVAEAGRLTFMVGGPAAALERVRPVLDVVGAAVFHLGAAGAGATMKLVVNAVLLGLNQAVAEGLVLAERAGLDRAAAYEVLAAGAVGAPFVQYKREAYLHPGDAAVAFTLELVVKDLGLAADLAAEVGARVEQLATNRRVAAEAVAAGLGSADLSAVAEHLRRPG